MKQSAVDWLLEQLNNNPAFQGQFFKEEFEKAKEIEKQQQDKFAIEFVNWIVNPDTTDLLHDLELFGEIDKEVTSKKLLEIYKKEKK
jgi:hypothetical protein